MTPPGEPPAAAAAELPEATIRLAVLGDEGAFELIVRQYRPRCRRTAASILGSGADADEVVQNTFVRFFRYGASYDFSRPLSSYLHRITVLECYRLLGVRRSRPLPGRVDLEAAGWHRSPRGETERLINEEKATFVREVLEQLTDRERVCFVLREVEGEEVAAIAESLGISPVTVRRFCSIARAKIAEALRSRFGSPDRLPRGE